MQSIEVKSDFIYYYGNPAGYIENDKAVIDPMFKSDELTEWFKRNKGIGIDWRDSVFDRLSSGKMDTKTGDMKQSGECRIWQLKPTADPLIKYIGYDELLRVQGCPPDPVDYQMALCFQPDTDSLDGICAKFDEHPHPDLVGGKVNLSDIIEIRGENGSEYHYADRVGFVEVEFAYRQEQAEGQPQTAAKHEM